MRVSFLLGSIAGISRVIACVPMPGSTGGARALQTVVTPASVLVAFTVSAAVGISPASRAARLHPIQALRYQ